MTHRRGRTGLLALNDDVPGKQNPGPRDGSLKPAGTLDLMPDEHDASVMACGECIHCMRNANDGSSKPDIVADSDGVASMTAGRLAISQRPRRH